MVKHLIAITSLQQSNYAMTDMLALNSYIEPEVAQRVQNAHLNIKFSNLLYLLRDDNAFVPISKTLRYIKLLADFRSSSSINDMVWQYFVLPNYYYTYSDLLAIMRSQMPDGLEEYLVKRYPDLYSFDDTTCPVIRV